MQINPESGPSEPGIAGGPLSTVPKEDAAEAVPFWLVDPCVADREALGDSGASRR
jgi:hypothetical protein